MPVCDHCGTEWSWKKTAKAFMKAWFELHCPYCREKQYETKSSRWKTQALGFMPLLGLPLFGFTDLPWYSFLIWIAVSLPIALSIVPFVMKVSGKEEFYF